MRSILWVVVTVVLAAVGGGLFAVSVRAEACPDEGLRQKQAFASRLPDCRAYEQVSPVAKNFTDAAGEPGAVQASPSGGGVTFFSNLPFPGGSGSHGVPVYLSNRGEEGWATQALLPLTEPGKGANTGGWSEDLSKVIVISEGPPLAPGATTAEPGYSYLRDSASGSYQTLGPGLQTYLMDSTLADSRVLFESTEQLLPTAAPGAVNLYEWHGGQVSLEGVLPDGSTPSGGSVAGPGGPAPSKLRAAHEFQFYTRHTISDSGVRVYFTDTATGQIYVRVNDASTVQVSASQGAPPVAEYWRAATPDGRYVFFTSEARLTADATASPTHPDLYRFDIEGEEGKRITDLTTEAPEGAGVLGTLGVSDDGSYAYFAALGLLASGAVAQPERVNLYQWHNGVTKFVTTLAGRVTTNVEEQVGLDAGDWRGYLESGSDTGPPAQGEPSARVTSDGTTVLFVSTVGSSTSVWELFLYDALDGRLRCVSCNPAGGVATSGAALGSNEALDVGAGRRSALLTRNLSADGGRVFFQTPESLVPQDTNGQMDVYEWEREGKGACQAASPGFSPASGGCLYLLSSGRSTGASYFGDASRDGSDVFLFTRQSLIAQDGDSNIDVYDARVDGGIAAQNMEPPAPCGGEDCRPTLAAPPAFGAPSSAMVSGAGNLSGLAVAPAKGKTAAQVKAEELARALKACKRMKGSTKRRRCEARARKKYGKRATRSGHATRSAAARPR